MSRLIAETGINSLEAEKVCEAIDTAMTDIMPVISILVNSRKGRTSVLLICNTPKSERFGTW
jgi:hypothetical protein